MEPERPWRKGFAKEMSFKSEVRGDAYVKEWLVICNEEEEWALHVD